MPLVAAPVAFLSGQRWKPKLHLDGGAWHLRALVEQSPRPLLKAGHHGVQHTRDGNLSHRFSKRAMKRSRINLLLGAAF